MTARCECPSNAVGAPPSMYEPDELKARAHDANECPGDVRVRVYIRDGKRITLCSACCLFGDVEVQAS